MRAAALLVGGLLGALAWHWLAPAAAPPPARAHATPGHIALNVRREGRMLRFEWDRGAPAIRTAGHARLHIDDGSHQTDLNLSAGELSAGLLSYWPDTQDVGFRLQVFGASNTDDSIRAVWNSAPPASAPASPLPAAPTAEAQPAPPRREADSRRRRPLDADENTASRAALEEPKPSPLSPPQPVETSAVAAPAPKPAPAPVSLPPPAARVREPRVEVSAEPVPPSRWSRMVRHIPLFGRLRKRQSPAVAPQPIHEAKPTLSAAERRSLSAEVPIDVRVYVTDAGKVDFAELLDTRSAMRHTALADAAVFAARRWDFRPARLGEENVASEVILHFRFKPPGAE